MIGNTVCAGGVVVYETEIVGCVGEDLGYAAERVETMGERAWVACVSVAGDGF